MKTLKLKAIMYGLVVVSGCLLGTASYAQLIVDANGSVGIGYTTATPPFTGKLDVQVAAGNVNLYSAYLRNLNASNSTKYGVYNTVSNAGTGGRYGIFSDVQQNSASTSTVFGLYTNTNAYGFAYGHYNILSGNGSGGQYGTLNYSFKNATNTSTNIGIYNYSSHNNNTGYGLYNYYYNGATTGGIGYGVQNYMYSLANNTSYGIYNQVIVPTSTITGARYGIYNQVDNIGTGIKYGIYSSAPGTNNYAGYFNGNVTIQGNFAVISDDDLKTEVSDIPDALLRVDKLRGVNFKFKQGTEYDLPHELQYGFLASNVQEVAPEIVFQNRHPVKNTTGTISSAAADSDKDPEVIELRPSEPKDCRSVNYVAIIPLLVQAIKELNAINQAQEERIARLEEKVGLQRQATVTKKK